MEFNAKNNISWNMLGLIFLLANHLLFSSQPFYGWLQMFTFLSLILAYQDYHTLHIDFWPTICWLICLSLHSWFDFPTYWASFFLVEIVIITLVIVIYNLWFFPVVGVGDYLLLSSSILVPLDLVPLFLLITGASAILLWFTHPQRSLIPFGPSIFLGVWLSIIISFMR